MSSSVAMETPELPTLPYTSGRSSGSNPYRVTESKAVDRRLAGCPSASRWKRRLVRAGPPSPANIRAGSSPSRLNGNTPAVKGKRPGRFSERSQRVSSPRSPKRGSDTRETRVPDSDVRCKAVVVVRVPVVVTSSSPDIAATVDGHSSRRPCTDADTVLRAAPVSAGRLAGASVPKRSAAHSRRSSSLTRSACTTVSAW